MFMGSHIANVLQSGHPVFHIPHAAFLHPASHIPHSMHTFNPESRPYFSLSLESLLQIRQISHSSLRANSPGPSVKLVRNSQYGAVECRAVFPYKKTANYIFKTIFSSSESRLKESKTETFCYILASQSAASPQRAGIVWKRNVLTTKRDERRLYSTLLSYLLICDDFLNFFLVGFSRFCVSDALYDFCTNLRHAWSRRVCVHHKSW